MEQMQNTFNADYFRDQLRTTWLGSEFIHLDEVASTNTYLKTIPASQLVHGMVVNADHQTRGRGQYEKKWEATPGENLTFTIAFCPVTADRLTLLTLGCAYAISGVLAGYTEKTVQIKWPNDLYIDGKKMGGLLTECIFFGSKPERVLIGIGMNVYQEKFSKKLAGHAVSLSSVTDKPVSRELLLAQCLNAVEAVYHRWHKQDASLSRDISRLLTGYGEWVQLSCNEEILDGSWKFLGINEKGELWVLNEQLDVNTFTHEQIRIITGQHSI